MSTICWSLDQPSHGMVMDMMTPTIAPATARTARSSAGRPVRLARASLITAIVRANSSMALARTSGTVMVRVDGLPDHVEVGLAVGLDYLPDGGADGGDRAELGRLPLERLDHPGVHVVLQDEVFLGGEVPEERAR